MQVANTLNNTIRILFNPKIEAFKLFDFLMVKSDDSKYIAQIIEIYDDKFDASQNVAKLKLFYQVNQNSEVMPYDNFTPNKECEIVKVKQDEIESFINQDKETFIFGTNVKSSTALNLQYDFFNNNAVVLADKVENANSITYNLAKNLSSKRNVVIIDQTGVLDYEDARKIKAGKNFRMPLNYTTIDNIFNKCLYDASLEFQAIGGEIINEIKRFAKKQENEFIPFNQLTRVLIQQYKATPYPELKLLLVRLKKYQMDEVFAKTKNDKENLFKTIEKNSITILDLSGIDTFWQKAYIEYIISDLQQEIYLISRINDEHFDSDLISMIYNKKKNIKFVPNVSYNYKRLPSVMQNCKNYILMPSLFQRADFLDANFALSNLISQGCVIFGENTDNFLYLARDYELEVQEKRKNYRKIALTLAQQDQEAEQKLGKQGDFFENKEKADSESLIKELSEFDASQKATIEAVDEYIETNAPDEDFDDLEDKNTKESNIPPKEEIKTEEDLIFNDTLSSSHQIEQETPQTKDEFQELGTQEEEIVTEQAKETEENSEKEPDQEDEKTLSESEISDSQEENQSEEIEETQEAEEQEEQIDISDEELDFFQMAQDSDEEYSENETASAEEEIKEEVKKEEAPQVKPPITATSQKTKEENVVGTAEEKIAQIFDKSEEAQEENNDAINLAEIADNSINDCFEEIINAKAQPSTQTITIDDNIKLSEDILTKSTQKENLPIFKDEDEDDNDDTVYEVGAFLHHEEYGRGKIVNIINFEDRVVLSIEFETEGIGKKMIDPKVTNITLEQ